MLVFGIAIAFILSFAVPIINAGEKKVNIVDETEIWEQFLATHTVFAEEASATWCGYCPTVITIMHNIYQSGQYDFYYVTLVDDKNSYASGRIGELGVTGFPTVVYDGGYTRLVGAGYTQTDHENAIINCGQRNVANIDLDLSLFWLGGNQISTSIDVTNNEGSTYNGHLHVYITEENSRWYNQGTQYHFAMIGNYAINQNVNVGAGQTETYTSTWTSPHSDITMSNIKGIASVFDGSTKYTDETDAADPQLPNSDPPSTPTQPSGPSTGIVGIPNTYSTSSFEPNGDTIKYGWDWDNDDDVDDWTNYKPSGQSVSMDYSWDAPGYYEFKVKAEDQFGTQSGWSQVKSVQIGTGTPPITPSAPTGETDGGHNIQYSYSASTSDPDVGDEISYLFDWGDGTDSGWKGPYPQGQSVSASHKWSSPGNFDVKVKAKDLAGSETDWSPALTVNMDNNPPSRPTKPNGPEQGLISKSYTYSSSASDPDGDQIRYLFDWGDGTDSGWILSKSDYHSWSEEGTYTVKVKAKDNWEESSWSAPLSVEILSGDLDVSSGGPYEGTTGNALNFYGSVSGGTEPFTWEWNFGDGETSTQQNPTHTYSSPGEYSVSLSVEDDAGAQGVDVTTATISSNPPNMPTITGPEEGAPGTTYEFSISAIDPDGDDVYFWIEWFESCPGVFWQGPYESGEEVVFPYTWDDEGIYTISVKAKDIYDEVGQTGTMDVTMPRGVEMHWLVKLLQTLLDKFPIFNLFF